MSCKILPDLASNWENIDEIYRMMDKCVELGIEFAKLQLFKKDQVREEYWNNILNETMARKVFDYGTKLGLIVYFTPCYPEAVDICKRLGVKYYKIRYKDRNNADIFKKFEDIYEPVFVSCSDPKDTLYYGMKNAIFLYCVHKYPAEASDYNMYDAAKCDGISDHTPNIIFFKAISEFFIYWEMHIALRKGTIEERWSKTFDEISK